MIIGISGKKQSGKDTVAEIFNLFRIGLSEYDIIEKLVNDKETFSYRTLVISNVINENKSFEIKKFADKIKDIVCILTGCSREELEDDEFKNKIIDPFTKYHHGGNVYSYSEEDFINKVPSEHINRYGIDELIDKNRVEITYRYLLQLVGTEFGRNMIHEDVWVNATLNDYRWDGKSMTEGWIPTYNNPDNNGFDKEAEPIMPNWIITDVRFENELEAIKKRNGLVVRVNRSYNNTYKNEWKLYCKYLTENPNDKGLIELATNKGFINYIKLNNINLYNNLIHNSETSLDNYEDFDYVIENNGSIEDLIDKVKEFMEYYKLI